MNTYTIINENKAGWDALRNLKDMHKLLEKINQRFNIQSGILDVLVVNKISGIELAANLYDRNTLANYLSTLEGVDLKKNVDGLIWEIREELLEEAKNIVKDEFPNKFVLDDLNDNDPF